MHLTGEGQKVLTSQYTVVEYIPAARSLSRCRFHSKISGIACVDSRARDHEQGRGGEARRDGMQKGRPAASRERAEIKQDDFGEKHVVTKEAEEIQARSKPSSDRFHHTVCFKRNNSYQPATLSASVASYQRLRIKRIGARTKKLAAASVVRSVVLQREAGRQLRRRYTYL